MLIEKRWLKFVIMNIAPDEIKDAKEELNVSTSAFSSGLELNWNGSYIRANTRINQ